MLKETIIAHLQDAVRQCWEESGIAGDCPQEIMLEQPAHAEHGEYSTNAAMKLAKAFRQPPVAIANRIKAKLEASGYIEGLIGRIEVVAPGFLNLYLNWSTWAEHYAASAACQPQFGLESRALELKSSLSAQAAMIDPSKSRASKKVLIEHTSINPNKSAHIGHLRNSCIGDTLVRLLRKTGHQVEVHNYIDDLGNQLADTLVGIQHTEIQEAHDRFGDFCWDVYAMINKKYASEPELQSERTRVLHAIEAGDNNTAWMGTLVAERIVREHVEEMGHFGINYDLLVWESSIVREGFWAKAFELLRQTDVFQQEQEGRLAGCWVLKQAAADETEESEHSQDKVLVRSNGILTYTAKDIAYHLWKFGLLEQDFSYKPFTEELWTTTTQAAKKEGAQGAASAFGQADMVINVIDYRQQYPQLMVKQALEALGYQKQADALHHVSYGVVSLSPKAAAELGIDTSDGKASYAMSGRQGIGIKIKELINRVEQVIDEVRPSKEGLSSREIAIASIRYYLLRFNLQTEVVFDLDQATEISGNTGVYLLYAYARANRVLNKAGAELAALGGTPDIPALAPAEHSLLTHLSRWPETLALASKELSPNVLCQYAFELATTFSNFYAACPILKGNPDQVSFRVWLTAQMRHTLGEVLGILGLPAPESM
ncbi:arginine--tRNA ligase [Paenibacillus sp. 1001270B_150601_E10]|uniref:arginine--tRNA ligase n=1 Tax=Paenibacillus sp. 1001270B_150601_E10 TaxID=2787079 RepID=UPI00189F80C0|nr:arginine--tRNA ligase [Paenibacillus sp. 1001270B_150601_E10]